MVSSKLTIKQQNRNKLYYSKFRYRAELSGSGVRFVFNNKTLQKCLERIDSYNEINGISIRNIDFQLLENLINFRLKYAGSTKAKIYRSGCGYDTFNVYTNDVAVLEELQQLSSKVSFTEVTVPPSEVMYFTKEPEYNYRVYLKSTRAKPETLSQLRSFRENYHKNGNICVSGGLVNFLRRNEYQQKSLYLPTGAYIDFKDEQTLTLMHILFGECLRKSCKLEKRPE